MADLTTHFMGLTLKNPVAAAASGITGSLDGVRKCADHGAGAVVLKSMFEEIIVAQSETLDRAMMQTNHPEAYAYVQAEIGMKVGPRPYLKFIADARRAVSIPVIASVNCSTSAWWAPYAKDIETAGAHAIELNISHFPSHDSGKARDIEKQYVDIVHEVTRHVTLPVAVKIGFYFTSLVDMMKELVNAGARALVLFNRFHTVDVDIKKGRFRPSMTVSSPQEITLPLRWVGIAAETLTCDIAASTGIHDSEGAIKMLMAGAGIVQVCSTLYLHGTKHLERIVGGIDSWLGDNKFASVSDIRRLAVHSTKDKESLLRRLQYLKALNEAAMYRYE